MLFLTVVLLTGLLHGSTLVCSQGIKGKVVWVSGNQMPGPGKNSGSIGVKREIFFHRPATSAEVVKNEPGILYQKINTELVATVMSKGDGSFKIKLLPGEYSVFIKEPKGYFGNVFDDKGRIQVVKVEPGRYTEVTLSVDYMAAY
jgi:hypothetical protein